MAGYLQQVGYRIIRLTPMTDTVLGEKVYRCLRDVAARADVVPIFRHPSAVPPVVKDVIAIDAKVYGCSPAPKMKGPRRGRKRPAFRLWWVRAG
ncbi:MAG TPA: CoA-binding protein [bacterium]